MVLFLPVLFMNWLIYDMIFESHFQHLKNWNMHWENEIDNAT